MNLRFISRSLKIKRVLDSAPALNANTELKRLRAENARYKSIVHAAPIGFFALDSKMQIVEVNPAGASFLGQSQKELLRVPFINFIETGNRVNVNDKFSLVLAGEDCRFSTTISIRKKPYPVILQLTALRPSVDKDFRCHLTILDLSEHKATEENLRVARDGLHYVAHHDPLTRLPNRCGIKLQLQAALDTIDKKKVALLLLDLDHFKQVNDPLGHQAGDELLKAVADRLVSTVKREDIVGRLGGDEFAIILKNITNVSDVSAMAENISTQLALPYESVSTDIHLAASIGICVAPDHSDNSKELICYADAAMNQAKSRGRNRIQYYTEALHAMLTKRFKLERDLRLALCNSEFELYYQPQYDLRLSTVSGYEALLRWNHPAHGIINPADFIEVAETTGLIEPLGEWILTEACHKLAELRVHNKDLTLSVNVSAKQFANGDLRKKVVDILSSTGIPAKFLELELTESALMENADHSTSMLEDLREIGVALAIDDFGTGYSSFSRLQRLPVTRVKIDRSFIQDIPANQNNCSITGAIISVAHDLGIEVVAEGVETHKQALFLSEIGCDVLQGYYLGRPQPFKKIANRAAFKTVQVEAEPA